MTRLSLIPALAGLLWAAELSAASNPSATPLRFTVIVPADSGVQAPQVREKLERALIENGAAIVPTDELKKTEKQLSLPVGQSPDSPAAKQLATALDLDGIIELKVNRAAPSSGAGAKYRAEVRVLGADGQPRVETELPVSSRQLTSKELDNIADIAVDSVKAPTGTQLTPGAAATLPPTPLTGPPTPDSAKPPTPQRSLVFQAAPNLTWRSGAVNGAPPVQSLDFSTGAPYAGVTLGMELRPFAGSWSQFLGFDMQGSISVLGVNALNPSTNLTQRETATENRFMLDVIGHSPKPIFGGDLALSLGWAYQGFVLDPVGSLVTSQHNGPRIFLGYQRDLFKHVAINFGGGYRPFAIPGGGLTNTFGDREQSYGIEAHAGFSGPLEFLVHNLRWMAAYDFLRYSDLFKGTGGTTSNVENYNRILLGFTYQVPLRF